MKIAAAAVTQYQPNVEFNQQVRTHNGTQAQQAET